MLPLQNQTFLHSYYVSYQIDFVLLPSCFYTFSFLSFSFMYRLLKLVSISTLSCIFCLNSAFAQAPTASPLKTELDSLAYAIGVSVAGSVKSQGLSDINPDILARAIGDVLKNRPALLTPDQSNQALNTYFTKKNEEMQRQAAEKAAQNKKAGEAFLEQNKKRSGVITTASGLQYEVVKMGEGPKPAATDRVKTHYHGTLIDGTVFDSSVQRGTPAEFPVNGVITGWQEALQLMPVGSKFKLYLPSEIAYGDRGAGQMIAPGAALVFEVELLEIVK
jgi:FKBP-type peptidyl-prolyl cis-trans isomerase FklB